MVKRSITLDTITFDKAGSATVFFRAILNRYRDGEEISGDDAKHLTALLKRHNESQEKIGCGVHHYEVGIAPDGFGTRCFWIVRFDDTRVDFSYKHCLEPRSADSG